MTFSENLKRERVAKSITQKHLSELLGVSTVTISNWERGIKKPSSKSIEMISAVLKISPSVLFGANDSYTEQELNSDEKKLISDFRKLSSKSQELIKTICEFELKHMPYIKTNKTHRKLVRLFESPSAAGYGSPVEDGHYTTIELYDPPEGTTCAVFIRGTSMEPYINDCTPVLVNSNKTDLSNGDVGIFIVNGDAYCKQYYKDPSGNIYLISLNPEMKESNITIKYDSNSSIICFGKVLLDKQVRIPDYFWDTK